MSMLNIEREKRAPFQLEQRADQLEPPSDFRAHYKDLAIRTLLSVQRHWKLVVSVVTLAVLLALIAMPLIPRKYSATALIMPTLHSQEQEKVVALATVDGTSIVNGEARLVISDTVLHAVVRRLNPELLDEAGTGSGWLRSMFFPETRVESRFDREMSGLRSRIEVTKDARSYLISISFTGSSADQAARLVNTVAVEYAREKWVQKGREAVIAAEAELTRQRAVNGEKHPKVVQAVESLEVARADLKALMAEEIGQNSARMEDGIKPALPNHTPTSPKGTVIFGLALLLGLVAGIALAVRRDRRGLEPLDMTSARQAIVTMLGRRPAIGSRLHNAILRHIRGRVSPQQIGRSVESVEVEPPDSIANSRDVAARSSAAPVAD